MIARSLPLLALLVAGCAGPVYVDGAKEPSLLDEWPNRVFFRVYDAYRHQPPRCVAILPLKRQAPAAPDADGTLAVRRALYAHLAPQGKRDVELARVEHVLQSLDGDDDARRKALGEKLGCDAVLEGEVTEFASEFLGVYSRVAVGAELRMRRARDGELLWMGRHSASSYGGGLPLSPVGLAMGIIDAAGNASEEQLLRVTDDLARRLIGTIPDDVVASLDDPAEPVPRVSRRGATAAEFLADTSGQPAEERLRRMVQALETGRFTGDDGRMVLDRLLTEFPGRPQSHVAAGRWWLAEGDHDAAIAAAEQALSLGGGNAEAHFLKGRVLLLDRAFAKAEPSILQAVALEPGNPAYLNALGSLNARSGNPERALAAYQMAIEAHPADGFAYYNSAVIHYGSGDLEQAGDAFYGAALAYLKSGNYGRAEKALADLRDLKKAGMDVGSEIATIERALVALPRRKS